MGDVKCEMGYLQSIKLPKWPRYPNLVAEITIERLIGNRDWLTVGGGGIKGGD